MCIRDRDELARGTLAYAQRGYGHLVLVGQAHRVDGPDHLGVDRVAQAVLALHEGGGVLARVRLDVVHQLDGRPRGLERAAPAHHPELPLRALGDEHVRAEEDVYKRQGLSC